MNTLKNLVIWVVGGGSGIGQAIAVKGAAEGARVVISGRRAEALEKTAKIARKKGCALRTLPLDATDPGRVKAAAGQVINSYKKIDILVISIGYAFAGGLSETTFEDWKELEKVHLDAMFLCCKEALRGLKRSKSANILIIGSIFGLRGKENRLAYCAMKGAVANFVRALALDLAGKVRVNSICPGWVETDMSLKLVKDAPRPAAVLAQRHNWHPMGRGGEPEEVADLGMYLISEKAAWMTGQNIALDGGYTAR